MHEATAHAERRDHREGALEGRDDDEVDERGRPPTREASWMDLPAVVRHAIREINDRAGDVEQYEGPQWEPDPLGEAPIEEPRRSET